MAEKEKLVQKYTLSQLSDMAQYNPKHLKSMIQGHGVSVPLNGRRNVDLIDLACALQDGNIDNVPDWAMSDFVWQSGSSPLPDMIKAGNYDWVHSEITEDNFFADPFLFTTIWLKLYSLNTKMTTVQIETMIRSDGHELVGIEHLLAYGSKYPDEQMRYPIVALDIYWLNPANGECYYPYLRRKHKSRRLSLRYRGSTQQWSTAYRFLGIRKAA